MGGVNPLNERIESAETPQDDDGCMAQSEPAAVSDPRRADDLREQAARCRRLSSSVLDRCTLDALQAMASEYEEEAERLARMN